MSLCSGVLRLGVEEEAWFVDFPVGGWIHLIGYGPLDLDPRICVRYRFNWVTI